MSDYKPSSNFQHAATFLSSAPSLARVSSTIKLELYGLFKYLTSSKMPKTTRPSIFEMTGRAKWDAWTATGKKYENFAEAEERYLQIAHTLGWTEQTIVESKVEPGKSSTTPDEDDIWDKDEDPTTRSGGGLGLTVSSIAAPPPATDTSIHGLALSNDVSGLTALLEQCPETDLNALDQYGYAPIHLACDRGNVEMVKLLLTRGADRTIKDPDDLSPLELSKEANHTEIQNLLVSTA